MHPQARTFDHGCRILLQSLSQEHSKASSLSARLSRTPKAGCGELAEVRGFAGSRRCSTRRSGVFDVILDLRVKAWSLICRTTIGERSSAGLLRPAPGIAGLEAAVADHG